jgi:hypothetical protein
MNSICVGALRWGIDGQTLYMHSFAIVEFHMKFGTIFDPQAFQGQVATHEESEQLQFKFVKFDSNSMFVQT